MNTTRFINFGKYDLATNKVFYRNMVFMALGIGAGISALGFLGRYLTWKSSGLVMGDSPLDFYASYTNSTVTNCFLMVALSLMISIFAGCTFHALRKKQGRINELTLPASNGEKYAWHILLCVGGGLALAFASLLTADLVNYILHLAVYGNDGTFSLTCRVLEVMSVDLPHLPMNEIAALNTMLAAMKCLILCNLVMQICAYIYGNSVKYKYNIILTYLVLTLAGIAVAIVWGNIADANKQEMRNLTHIEATELVAKWMYISSAVLLVIGALLGWRSYKRYTKAQITSRLNK